jgi:hypothetical protein
MFFWSRLPVSNIDLKRLLSGYETIADPAIFNPIQPIYTAKPIFNNLIDPIAERIKMITPAGIFSQSVEIVPENQHYAGADERWYTKRKAVAFADKCYEKIAALSFGDRHNGLVTEGYLLGKLIGQNHFEREEVIQNACDACDFWTGKRDAKKDRDTLTWAIDRGISAMTKGDGQ